MLILLLLWMVPAEQVAAYVGDGVILESDVQSYVSYLTNDPSLRDAFATPDAARQYALDDLIARKLLMHQAEIDSVEVSEEEIESRLGTMIENLKSNFPSEADFYQELEKANLRLDDLKNHYRENIRTQLILSRLVNKQVVPSITVSPIAIRAFYDEHKDSIAVVPARIKLAHIIVPIRQSETEQKRGFERALEVYKLLMSGGDFGVIAQEFSDDYNSRKSGGMLGKMKKGETLAEFEEKVFALKPGEVSQPFPSRLGFHIVEVLNKGPDWVLARQILIKVDVTKSDTTAAEQVAARVVKLANEGADFDSLAKQYSYAPDVDLGEVVVKQLLPPLDAAVKDLGPGQASAPLLTPWGYQVLYVRDKVPEKDLSFEEMRDYIFEYLTRQEQEKIFKLYVDELKEKTFVQIFPAPAR